MGVKFPNNTNLKPALKSDQKYKQPLQVGIRRIDTLRSKNSETPTLKPEAGGVGAHLALVSQKTSIMKKPTAEEKRRKTAFIPGSSSGLLKDDNSDP